MCERNNSNNLLSGLIIGAAIGAGATFLFGTKKGKAVRDQLKKDYPEVFETIETVKDNLEEKYNDVVDDAPKKISALPRLFKGVKRKS